MNKYNKNKGFTLVELLVTIAIIGVIFTIAILSLNGISKKKKEVAYESVKQEVVTAAQQYLASNKYMLETLKNSAGSEYCTNNKEECKLKISVQELVNYGYLNKTINPTTNMALNDCDYVDVSVGSNNDISYTFTTNTNSDSDECPNANLAVKNLDDWTDNDTVPDNPVPTPTPTDSDYKLSAIIEGTTGLNGWLVGDSFDVHVREIGTKKNPSEIKYCVLNLSSNNNTDISNCSWGSVKDDSYTSKETAYPYGIGKIPKSSKYIIYLKYQQDDNASAIKLNINFDNVAPTISYVAKGSTKASDDNAVFKTNYNNGSWYNGYVLTSTSCKDDISGCADTYYTASGATTYNKNVLSTSRRIYAEGTSYIVYKVFDQAGNSNKTDAMVVKLERNVTMRFAIHDTNWATSIKNDNYVFNKNKGATEFNTVDTGDGRCTNCAKERYANACMNVNDYKRYFYVTAASLNNGKETEVYYNPYDINANGWKDGCKGNNCEYNKTTEINRLKYNAWCDKTKSSTGISKYKIIWQDNGSITLNDAALKEEYNCSNDTSLKVRISAHQYQYTSPAGNKSNIIPLYVDYYVNCGY